MMKFSLRLFALAAFFLGSSGLWAQHSFQGTPNIIQKKKTDWKSVSSEFFEIHYTSADHGLATLTARYAEEALYDATDFLDYRNRNRFALYLFLSPTEYIQSNRYPEDRIKGSGYTPVNDNSADVLFPGSQAGLRGRIRTAVFRLLLEDYYFGGGVHNTIKNTLLLHLPDWYVEGLTAYYGEGWSFEDDMYMSSLENSHILDFAVEGEGYAQHIVRKSVWHFIAERYGEKKLAEIFYMTRLTHSVESGIIHVLGITLKTLTERWREFVVQRNSDDHQYRDDFLSSSRPLRLEKGQRLLGFSMRPGGKEVAVNILEDGIQTLYLADMERGNLRSTGIKAGYHTNQLEALDLDMPMKWSHDGRFLLAVMYKDGQEQMMFYEADTKKGSFVPYQPRVDRIFDISWSHDNRNAVASALHQGVIDLYLFQPGGNGFKQLTEDIYDDLSPVWSLDDQSIYYASTRDMEKAPEQPAYDVFLNNFDVYRIGLTAGADTISRVTNSPMFSEFPVSAPNSFELYMVSDRSGVRNLEKINVFLGDSLYVTNMSQGFDRVEFGDSALVFTTPKKGARTLYFSSRDALFGEHVLINTRTRMEVDKEYLLRMRKRSEAENKAADTAMTVPDTVVPDTARAETDTTKKAPVRYYIFDDGGEDTPRPARNRRDHLRDKALQSKANEPERPDFNLTEVGRPGNSKGWVTDYVTTAFSYDPMFKLNMRLEVGLQQGSGDYRLNLGFRPYIDFRSGDFYADFHDLRGKIDWHYGLEQNSRYLNREEFLLRYRSNTARVGMSLPLSRYLSVGAEAHASLLHRKDLDPLIPVGLDTNAFMAGIRLNLTYDHTEKYKTYVKRGEWVSLDLSQSGNLAGFQQNFISGSADFRKYTPLPGHMVLATRLTGGGSFGPNPRQYFMGGVDEWLFSRFTNPDDFPIAGEISGYRYMEYLTPIRGFRFNARNGTKYMAANFELRIPVSRMTLRSLNSNPLYNMELIPFFDIGTTWRQGNPFSQKNPIDTEAINQYPLYITIQTLKSPFLMGFGSGIRLMIFGYSVRTDIAWGVEDYTILSPRLHLSLGKNF